MNIPDRPGIKKEMPNNDAGHEEPKKAFVDKVKEAVNKPHLLATEAIKKNKELTMQGIATGPQLVKELKFWLLEPVMLGIAALVGFLLVAFDIMGLFGEISVAPYAFVLMALTAAGLWFWKFWKYLPRGNRVLHTRVYQTGGILISAEEPPADGKIWFTSKRDETGKFALLNNPKVNFDISGGRPNIVCVEDFPTNLSVYEIVHEGVFPEKFAQKLCDNIALADNLGELRAIRDLGAFKQPTKRDWTPILLIIVMVMVAAVLVFTLGPMVGTPAPVA